MLFAIPAQIGYPALGGLIFGECAGLPIPGETALIVAGGLAAAGHLSLPLVILVAAVAATLGDTLGYWIGRRGGRNLLLRDGRWAAHRRRAIGRADRFFERYGTAAVFLGRFVPGVRYLGALVAGATRMPWPRFAVANALGAAAWAAAMASLASAAGPQGALMLASTGLIVGAIALAVTAVRRRRRSRAARLLPAPLAVGVREAG